VDHHNVVFMNGQPNCEMKLVLLIRISKSWVRKVTRFSNGHSSAGEAT